MEMTHDDVTKMLAALDGAPGLNQIDFACGSVRVQIERGSAGPTFRPGPMAAEVKTAAACIAKGETISSETAHTIRAPILGRFFRDGSAAQISFRVAANDIIGFIKIGEHTNVVKAGVNGIATCMVAENGSLVEYGQELFIVTPASVR